MAMTYDLPTPDRVLPSTDETAGRVSWTRNLSASELLFDHLPDALEIALGICAATASTGGRYVSSCVG